MRRLGDKDSIRLVYLVFVVAGLAFVCALFGCAPATETMPSENGPEGEAAVEEADQFQLALEEAQRMFPEVIYSDPEIAAASRASGSGQDFALGGPIPVCYIHEETITQQDLEGLYPVYQNGRPIAWLTVPNAEQRAKTNVIGNWVYVTSMGEGNIACLEAGGPCVMVRPSDPNPEGPAPARVEHGEWMADSEGLWYWTWTPGSAEESRREQYPVGPYSNPMGYSQEFIDSLPYSNGAPPVPFE